MIVTLLIKRLLASFFTFPTPGNIKNVAAGALVCGGVLATGVKTGAYKWQPIRDTRALGWAASYMLMRAFLEELVFRAAMLPHPKADETKWLGSFRFTLASLIPGLLFVVSHSLTTQREGETVLNDTLFLATVAFVGMMCSWAYWVTSGGLWAAVAIHFLAVFPWMVLLGGYRKTHTPHPMKVAGGRDLAPSGPASGADGIKQE